MVVPRCSIRTEAAQATDRRPRGELTESPYQSRRRGCRESFEAAEPLFQGRSWTVPSRRRDLGGTQNHRPCVAGASIANASTR
jgi:hypothetical protein